jgi:hypothetical protein
MTDSINLYYQYRSFDYLIKIKPSYQCFSDFYTFYHSFLEEVGRFRRNGKKQQKVGEFFKL